MGILDAPGLSLGAAAQRGDIAVNAYALAAADQDNTTALTAAVADATSQGDRRAVDLQGRELITTGLTLGNYSKLRAGGLTRAAGATSPVLTLPSQASLQAADRSVVERVRVNGVSKTSGRVGIAIGNHASLVMREVSVHDEGTGFRLRGTQFSDFYSAKAVNCDIGFDIASVPTDGGANSLFLASLQASECGIGVLVKNVNSGIPMHSIELVSPQILGSKVCALAVIGVQNLQVRGWAGEYNGQGPDATVVVAGDTIRRSSVFLSGSRVLFDGGLVAEATVSPAFVAENGSHLALRDMAGYGNPSGVLVETDATSKVSLAGTFGCIGVVHGVTHLDVDLTSPGCTIQGPPGVHAAAGLPNAVASPQAPGFDDTQDATLGAPGVDALHGAYDRVVFPGSMTGRIRRSMTLGTATLVAVNVRTSVDCKLEFKVFPNVGNSIVQMRAGQWVRIFWWSTATTAGTQNFIIAPGDSSGATVDVCRWQVVTGTDTPALRRQVGAALRGGWDNGLGVGSNAWLLAQARNPDAHVRGALTRDPTWQVVTAGTWYWDDGTTGAFSATLSGGQVLTYTATYGSNPTRTVTQPAIVRDSAGNVTSIPPMTVT